MNSSTANAQRASLAAGLIVGLAATIASRFNFNISAEEAVGVAALIAAAIHHYFPWVDDSQSPPS